MAGLIRRSDIDEVRSRINIADVVGDYVTLKSAGVGSLKGLCPFHDERSPSFHVRQQAGRYHCFGCGEDGDVFTFLQKLDHVTFSEAVERMAAKVGIELHYEDGGSAANDRGNRARLLAANQAAADFFIAQLATPGAEPGRAFLGARGFDPSAAAHFGVGFAPKSYDALSNHLKELGFTEEELLASGLVGQGDRGTYDRFRGRLVWPIRDTTGQTLGFGARKLLDDDQGPKYLNTPETSVYHKSQVLYGLDLAKRDISRGKRVVVVEGYTDVMACHLAGVTTAVATCGTAFGVDHIKVIRRVLGDVENSDSHGLGEVIFTFDPDEAGQKAASRAFAEEQRFAAQTFVAVAPDGLDPCDLRLTRGDDALRRLVDERKPMFEFMIRRVLTSFDLDTVEGRVGALRAAAPVVAGIRDPALHAGYIRNLAGWIGVDPQEVSRAVSSAGRAKPIQSRSEDPRSPDARRSDARGPSERPAEPGPSITNLPTDPVTRLERDALMAVLQQPEEVGRDLILRMGDVSFTNATLTVVRDGIAASMDGFGTPGWVDRVAEEVPAVFSGIVSQLVVAPIPEKSDRELSIYCKGVVASLVGRDLLARKAELLGRLQRTDAAAEPDRYRDIQRELMSVEADRRALIGE
ncbi:DNA primase [Cryobacterium mesophilum]|uniref:DNA primase n=1 Tax=Terrimesophilobacter mesophilus TaxID=433647 RepID=A0A4R8VB65_9MICO|nr:DNA primase [Terrimesophilobacter mesophilus]MBB5632233.1 DNA primase [Terrimesophilobacter mesophilus]TFB79087.1 DNA primase [Terrimesophilobacter mesophilus]